LAQAFHGHVDLVEPSEFSILSAIRFLVFLSIPLGVAVALLKFGGPRFVCSFFVFLAIPNPNPNPPSLAQTTCPNGPRTARGRKSGNLSAQTELYPCGQKKERQIDAFAFAKKTSLAGRDELSRARSHWRTFLFPNC